MIIKKKASKLTFYLRQWAEPYVVGLNLENVGLRLRAKARIEVNDNLFVALKWAKEAHTTSLLCDLPKRTQRTHMCLSLRVWDSVQPLLSERLRLSKLQPRQRQQWRKERLWEKSPRQRWKIRGCRATLRGGIRTNKETDYGSGRFSRRRRHCHRLWCLVFIGEQNNLHNCMSCTPDQRRSAMVRR